MTVWEVLAILFVIAMAAGAAWLAFWYEAERKKDDDG